MVRQEELAANLGSPLKLFNWRMEIPAVPGGGDSAALKFRCQSSVLPGGSIETIHFDFEGTPGVEFPGRSRKTQEIAFTFAEGEDLKIWNAFNNWYKLITSGASDSATRTAVYLYDVGADRADISKIKLIGCFLKNLSDTPRSFDNGGVVLSVTLAFTDFE